MSHQALAKEYVPAKRPYSQRELEDRRENMRKSFRLSEIRAEHSNCQHFYHVRLNGRKEKQIIESQNNNAGNCSVCWKLGKTHDQYSDAAYDMCIAYMDTFYNVPERLTYDNCDLEETFYSWLYEETGSR